MRQGDLIAGKYRVDRILGQGGMGMVVAATNVLIDQPVALKFLLPELLNDAAVVERLLREARASARLRSEHVCLVYDVGNENGAPFIVMELLDGRDLASMVSTRTVLPVPVVTNYVLQAAVGLAEAHALGIVHRDLKPANLFLTKRLDGTPLIKVLDFGIAKAPSDTQFQLTRTAAVMGSPGYMSPEQLRSSRDADVRSDIWALGVILFELTAGRPPFVAESITELTLRVAMDPTPRLPGVPPEFERVVARCLEKDPSRRFADVGQLAAALAPFGTGRAADTAAGIASMLRASPVRSSAPVVSIDSTPTTLGSSASSALSLTFQRSRLPWVVLAGGALVAAVAVVALATGRGSGNPAQQPAHDEARAPAGSTPTAADEPAARSDTAVGAAAQTSPPITSVPSTAAPSPPGANAPPSLPPGASVPSTATPTAVTSVPPTAPSPQGATAQPPARSSPEPLPDGGHAQAAASSPTPAAKRQPATQPSPTSAAEGQPTTSPTHPAVAKGQPASAPTPPAVAKGQPASAPSPVPVARPAAGRSQPSVAGNAGTSGTPSPSHKAQRSSVDAAAPAPPSPTTPKATPTKDIGASRE